MLTNTELQELAHFKVKLRQKMALNIELSTLATNTIYRRDILAQADKYAQEHNDDELKQSLSTIRQLTTL